MPKNVGEKKFSELGLPGVEILSGACTSILHLSRGSQLPYSENPKKNPKFYDVLNICLFALFTAYFPGLELSYRGPWYIIAWHHITLDLDGVHN